MESPNFSKDSFGHFVGFQRLASEKRKFSYPPNFFDPSGSRIGDLIPPISNDITISINPKANPPMFPCAASDPSSKAYKVGNPGARRRRRRYRLWRGSGRWSSRTRRSRSWPDPAERCRSANLWFRRDAGAAGERRERRVAAGASGAAPAVRETDEAPRNADLDSRLLDPRDPTPARPRATGPARGEKIGYRDCRRPSGDPGRHRARHAHPAGVGNEARSFCVRPVGVGRDARVTVDHGCVAGRFNTRRVIRRRQ